MQNRLVPNSSQLYYSYVAIYARDRSNVTTADGGITYACVNKKLGKNFSTEEAKISDFSGLCCMKKGTYKFIQLYSYVAKLASYDVVIQLVIHVNYCEYTVAVALY